MRVEFLSSFKNDLKKIVDIKLKKKIKAVIIKLEEAEEIKQIKSLKKMKSRKGNVYRIRIGDYRLGFYMNNDVITLARFVKRSDIYKLFP